MRRSQLLVMALVVPNCSVHGVTRAAIEVKLCPGFVSMMSSPRAVSNPPSVVARLLWSSAGFALAVALALGSAHWYEPPRIEGSAGRSIWFEPDFLCSVASSAVALGVGVWSGRAALGPGATAARSLSARVVIWAAFTLLCGAVWVAHLVLFTLLVAPAHAFACLRLVGLWSRWRADRAWRRQLVATR
jgi:hypothetical protein